MPGFLILLGVGHLIPTITSPQRTQNTSQAIIHSAMPSNMALGRKENEDKKNMCDMGSRYLGVEGLVASPGLLPETEIHSQGLTSKYI